MFLRDKVWWQFMTWSLLLEQTLNGLQLGMTLFLLASGLTLTFGIMGIINLAHGATYMIGAYIAAVTMAATGSFLIAVCAGMISAGIIGCSLNLDPQTPLCARSLRPVLAHLCLSYCNDAQIFWHSVFMPSHTHTRTWREYSISYRLRDRSRSSSSFMRTDLTQLMLIALRTSWIVAWCDMPYYC
jgi:Branched-chain amino acid ABC-type transport system, permease components